MRNTSQSHHPRLLDQVVVTIRGMGLASGLKVRFRLVLAELLGTPHPSMKIRNFLPFSALINKRTGNGVSDMNKSIAATTLAAIFLLAWTGISPAGTDRVLPGPDPVEGVVEGTVETGSGVVKGAGKAGQGVAKAGDHIAQDTSRHGAVGVVTGTAKGTVAVGKGAAQGALEVGKGAVKGAGCVITFGAAC